MNWIFRQYWTTPFNGGEGGGGGGGRGGEVETRISVFTYSKERETVEKALFLKHSQSSKCPK